MSLQRTPKPLEYVTTWNGKALSDMTRGELETALVEAWNMQQQAIENRDTQIMLLNAVRDALKDRVAELEKNQPGGPPADPPGGGPP